MSRNKKLLDYEIETLFVKVVCKSLTSPKKEKHLDYEIETIYEACTANIPVCVLKSKAARLRD